jgi:hypothetical protein
MYFENLPLCAFIELFPNYCLQINEKKYSQMSSVFYFLAGKLIVVKLAIL